MKEYNISYPIWKNIVNKYSLKTYYCSKGVDRNSVFSGNAENVFISFVEDDYYTDWLTNFSSSAESVNFNDDAILQIIDYYSGIIPVPRTADGKLKNSTNVYEEGMSLYLTSNGDSVSELGGGSDIVLSPSDQGLSYVTFSFKDRINLGGGRLQYKNMLVDDYVNIDVIFPATVVTENNNNTGNVNVVYGYIIPANNNGAYDLDYDDAIPLLVSERMGYFNWNFPKLGKGTVTPSLDATGNCMLSNVGFTRSYAKKLRMIGDGINNICFDSIIPANICPHWQGKVSLYNCDGAHTPQIIVTIIAARFF